MTNKILFFPFTYMSKKQLNTVLAFFPSFQYLPVSQNFDHDKDLQTLFENGQVHPFFLSPKESATMEKEAEHYQAWARLQKGNETNLKLLLKDSPYFTSDTNVTAIKTQIKGRKKDKEDNKDAEASLQPESALQRHLLFLKMAHLWDEQNDSIDSELQDLDTDHNKLMSALRGPENPLSDTQNHTPLTDQDSGVMMTIERMYAWSGRMKQAGILKQEGEQQPLFVTTSEAVFDYLGSVCKELVNALDIDKIKVHENECENKNEWQHDFFDYLMRAIQGRGTLENDILQVNDSCSLSGQVKLNIFSGNDINKLFNCADKPVSVCLIKLK